MQNRTLQMIVRSVNLTKRGEQVTFVEKDGTAQDGKEVTFMLLNDKPEGWRYGQTVTVTVQLTDG